MLTINPYRLGNKQNIKAAPTAKQQSSPVNFAMPKDSVSFSGAPFRTRLIKRFLPSEAFIAKKKMTAAFTKLLKDGTFVETGYQNGIKEYEVLEKDVFLINKEYDSTGQIKGSYQYEYTDKTQKELVSELDVDYEKNAKTKILFGPKDKMREVTYETPEFTEYRKYDLNEKLTYVETKHYSPTGCEIRQIYNPNSKKNELLEKIQTELDGTVSHIYFRNDKQYKTFTTTTDAEGYKVTTEDLYDENVKLSERKVEFNGEETQIYTFRPGGEKIANSARIIKHPKGMIIREERYYGDSITADYGLVYIDDQLSYRTKYDYRDKLSEAMDNEGYLVPIENFNVFREDSRRKLSKLKDWENLVIDDATVDWILASRSN